MVLNYIFVGCPWVVRRTVEDQLKETTIEASKTGKGFINVKLWKWWGYRFAELRFRVGFRDRIFKLDFELGSPGCRRLFSARFPVSVYGLPLGPKGRLRMGLRPTPKHLHRTQSYPGYQKFLSCVRREFSLLAEGRARKILWDPG